MEVYVYEGKNVDDLLEKGIKDLNLTTDDILYKKEIKKGGLFKSETTKLTIIKIEDIQKELKEYLDKILVDMGLKVTYESNIREKQINIKMYSDNNAILIGKNGQTLAALTTIAKQYIYNKVGVYPYLNLDVENYKDKQVMHLEHLAKNIAREVRETNNPVAMENMNSYERRIVHNALTNFKGISTESEGEEPNRHVVIRPKKD
jgi:spoIIIJ-associated protein